MRCGTGFKAATVATALVAAAGWSAGAAGPAVAQSGKDGPTAVAPGAADDHPDSPGTQAVLVPGGPGRPGRPVTGTIERPRDADWFAVELEADIAYIFDMEGQPTGGGTLSDGVLTLHDANGAEVAMDDDGGDGFNPRLVFLPPRAGRYFAAAHGFGNNTGSYTLSAVARPDITDDYPASAETGGRVANGRPGHGEIELPGDVDWFAVELDPGTAYVFDMEGQPTAQGTLADPLLVLYDPAGREVASDDDGATGLNARITFQPEQGGTYHLAAQAFGSTTGTYTLSMDRHAGFTDDFAAGPQTEGRMAIGDTVTGSLELPGDEDWFAVSLDRGTTYTIDLEGQPTGAGTLPDPLLSVHDSAGRQLATDDDGGTNFDARLTFSPPADGVYFVNAGAFGNNSGTYRLTIREGGRPASAPK